MILSWPIDIADGESIVTAWILSDSNFYIDKMLSVYTIRMEPSLRDLFIDSRQIQEF